jgi:sensor histidine kinase YesM
MTMDNLKKAAKVMANILVAVYKLNMVVLFLLMIFSPKTYMKIVDRIVGIIYAVVDKFSCIKKKITSKCKGGYNYDMYE